MKYLSFVLLGVLSGSLEAKAPWFQCQRERYYDGDRVSCVVDQDLMDGAMPDKIITTWTLNGKIQKKESRTLTWPYKTLCNIDFQLPSGQTTLATLSVDATFSMMKGHETFPRAHVDLLVYPNAPSYWNVSVLAGKRIMLLDSSHLYAQEMKRLDLTFTEISRLPDPDSSKPDLLVLGPLSSLDTAQTPIAMSPYLQKGWSILVLEQNNQMIDRRVVFALKPNLTLSIDPTDNGLTWDSTCPQVKLPTEIHNPRLWGRLRTLGNNVLSTSSRFDFTPLWDYGACSEQSHRDGGLALRYDEGQGHILFSQLGLSGHFQDEPLARWWLLQLLQRAVQSDYTL